MSCAAEVLLQETEEVIRDEIGVAHAGTCAQVSIAVDGESVMDIAIGDDGLGRVAEQEMLFNIYCAGKPVVAAAIGALVDSYDLSFDDVLGDLIDEELHPLVAEARVDHVLAHRAGLHFPLGIVAMLAPPEAQHSLACLSPAEDGARPGLDLNYSEFAGWHLLGLAIENLTGMSAQAFVRESVLEPYGIDRELALGMTPTEFDALEPYIGVNVTYRGMLPVPLLAERLSENVCAGTLAFGAYASAGGLRRLYDGLLADRHGAATVVTPETAMLLTTAFGESSEDPLMKRTCGWGLGFMTNLAEHDFGPAPAVSTFGHSGLAGGSFGFADPTIGLSAAVIINGIVDSQTAVRMRRPRIVNAIYRDLARVGGLSPSVPSPV